MGGDIGISVSPKASIEGAKSRAYIGGGPEASLEMENSKLFCPEASIEGESSEFRHVSCPA